jgi:hypothetical protein
VPKDEWRRARNQKVARRARYELATGKRESFEYLSDEITPLDRINVLEGHPTISGPGRSPPAQPQPERTLSPIPAPVRSNRTAASVRFAIAGGVSVLVNFDNKSKMSVVQALEAALVQARSRSALRLRPNAVGATPTTRKQNLSNPPTEELTAEGEIAAIRRKLKALAEAIVVKNADDQGAGRA